jgi:hypothetical protein
LEICASGFMRRARVKLAESARGHPDEPAKAVGQVALVDKPTLMCCLADGPAALAEEVLGALDSAAQHDGVR